MTIQEIVKNNTLPVRVACDSHTWIPFTIVAVGEHSVSVKYDNKEELGEVIFSCFDDYNVVEKII